MKIKQKNFLNSLYFISTILINQICTYSFFLNFLNEDLQFTNFGKYYSNFIYIFLIFTFLEFGTNFYSLKNILISKKLDFFYNFLNYRQYLFVFTLFFIFFFKSTELLFYENFIYLFVLFFSFSFLCHPYQIFLRYKNNFKILFYSSIIQFLVIILFTILLLLNNSLNIILSIGVLLISIIVKLLFLTIFCRKKYKLLFFKFKNIEYFPNFFVKSFRYFAFFFSINLIFRADLVILNYLNFSQINIFSISLYTLILSFLFLPYMSYLNVLINSLTISKNNKLNDINKSELAKIIFSYTTFGIFILIIGFLDDKFLFIDKSSFIFFIGTNIIIIMILLNILYLLFFFVVKSKYKECSIILFSFFFLKFLSLKYFDSDNFYFLITSSNLFSFVLVFIITLFFYNSAITDNRINRH